jgi:hypothetical protein
LYSRRCGIFALFDLADDCYVVAVHPPGKALDNAVAIPAQAFSGNLAAKSPIQPTMTRRRRRRRSFGSPFSPIS